jgi:hypothetical protein
MSATKHLGKIASIRIGGGGYQDVMFGIAFQLSFGGAGVVGDFWGAWGPSIKHDERCQWTEDDRQKQLASAFWRLANVMQQAKVDDVAKLAGVPVEVEIESLSLKSWRVLTEVL